VVHELAHQWFGDSVALARWQDIWLNEGFATYAEWLWLEHEGFGDAPRAIFTETLASIPGDDPFWDLTIGDPRPGHLFDEAVYVRGAMTLQALRETVGDRAFFTIARVWAQSNSGGHGTTPEFVATAERISGRELDALFDTWLFSPERPALPAAATQEPAASRSTDDVRSAEWREGLAVRHAHGSR
jgi:aminopeptidase N